MKKLFQITGQPIEEIIEFINQGGDCQKHSFLWGYDVFPKYGFEVSTAQNENGGLISKLGEKLMLPFLKVQLDCLRRSSDIDLVFSTDLGSIYSFPGSNGYG